MTLITGKVPLVVFSGGFDSTAMLFTQLTKYAEVDIISAALHGQTNKTQRESDAIEGIIRTLRKIQKKDTSVSREHSRQTQCRHQWLSRWTLSLQIDTRSPLAINSYTIHNP